jgi:hypothetical protein
VSDEADMLYVGLAEQSWHCLEPDFHPDIQGDGRGAPCAWSGPLVRIVVKSEGQFRTKAYLSGTITRTPQSLASLSTSRVRYRLPNMGPMNKIAGNDSSLKLLVVA